MSVAMMGFGVPGSPAVGAVIPSQQTQQQQQQPLQRARATSMSFHENGVHLFVASESDSRLQLINCLTGKADQPAIRCEREGIRLVEATHHELCVLFAGKGKSSASIESQQQFAINYLSVYDNKVLRKFRGHENDIIKISMSPADDCFLSSSADRTVRFWSTQQAGALAKMDLPKNAEGNPYASFDSTGLVFAITAPIEKKNGHYVHLYDARNYTGGAFAELQVLQRDLERSIQELSSATRLGRASELSKLNWNNIQFNTSGSQLLVSADQNMSIVLDGFEGTVKRVLLPNEGRKKDDMMNINLKPKSQPTSIGLRSCFTPDDLTVLNGNDDGSVSCWNIESGAVVKTLDFHTDPIGCIACNPKYKQFASCCTSTALWVWQ